MKQLENKVFFVGLGAQKAGTTWVAQYLRAHPEAFIPKYKELHFFNSQSGYGRKNSEELRFLRKFRELVDSHRMDPENPQSLDYYERLEQLIDRLKLFNHPERYLDIFSKRVQPVHRIFGEITPSYSLVDIESLERIRSTHRPVKVLFLMRDPVARIWSNLWFKHSKNTNYDPFQKWQGALEESGIVERTRYEKTVNRIDSVFAPEEVMYGFFETMFQDDFVRKLCSFLDLSYIPADFSANPNPTQGTARTKPTEFVSAVKEQFSETYSFASTRFGPDCPWK